jgi:pimeloyl-ACP methyl ester carboxylesterase
MADLHLTAPRTRSVRSADGTRLHVEVRGPEDGPTVVLSHCWSTSLNSWARVVRELPEHLRVVLYDQRGHGRSERAPRESCTIEQLGHDLDAVIRALAPEGPLVLVGHSMGGMTIMALAEQHPELFTERVAGVALVSTSAGEVASGGLPGTLLSRHNPLTRSVGFLARLQPTLVETARKALGDVIWSLTRSFAYGDRNVAPWLVDLVDTMISTNAVDALIDFADNVNSHDRVAALAALAGCEVLVASGTADRVISPERHAARLHRDIPHSELRMLTGLGHMLHHVARDEVVKAIDFAWADAQSPR